MANQQVIYHPRKAGSDTMNIGLDKIFSEFSFMIIKSQIYKPIHT